MNTIPILIKRIELLQLRQCVGAALNVNNLQHFAAFSREQTYKSRQLSVYSALLNSADDSENAKNKQTKRLRWNRGYSAEDDKFIATQIELHGYNSKTFKKIVKELGLKDIGYQNIGKRYKFHIANKPSVKGRFSSQEDETILDYVARNGQTVSALEDLTLLLGRCSPHAVKARLNYLNTGNVRIQQHWKDKDYNQLIKFSIDNRHFYQHNGKDNNYLPENIRISDLDDLAKKLQRSPQACAAIWKHTVLPVLKTYNRGLSLKWNWLWQIYLMELVIERKVEKSKDINIYELLDNEPFAGQTYASLSRFVRRFEYNSHKIIKPSGDQKSTKIKTDDILWEKVAVSYNQKSYKILCYNEKKKEEKLIQAQNMIYYYNKLV